MAINNNLTFWQKVHDLGYRVRVVGLSTLAFCYVRLFNIHEHKVVLCYPQKPQLFNQLYATIKNLGYTVTNDPTVAADIVINYQDTTFQKPDPILEELAHKYHVINLRCTDISKRHVEEVFTKVFGYGTHLDPRTHSGACVRKSDTNARHDGQIIECPTEPQAGYIYQKLLNSVCQKKNKAVEMRTYIFGGAIAFSNFRYKNLCDRFDNTNEQYLITPDEAFSVEEQKKIVEFCHAFGFEYGELDILRDNDDGKIYIVDVNNTPGTPHPGINAPTKTYRDLINKAALGFKAAFITSGNYNVHAASLPFILTHN